MFEEKFNESKFCEFIKDLLNLENENIINGQKLKATSEQYKNYIDTTQIFAKYKDSKKIDVARDLEEERKEKMDTGAH